MNRQRLAKVTAILALLWIIASIVWTSALYIFSGNNSSNQEIILTAEELQKLMEQNPELFATGALSFSWVEEVSSWKISE